MDSIAGTEFEKNYLKISGVFQSMIVHIDDGTNDWYFSEIDMELTEGHVYPLLKSLPTVKGRFDIGTKNWSVSDVTINLYNAAYKLDDSFNKVMLSDEIGDLINATVKIYLATGSNITGLSDCIEKFSGLILTSPEYDDESVKIKAVDAGTASHKLLPQTYMTSVFNATPIGFRDQKIPIAYGEFTSGDYALDGSGLGFAKAIPNHQSIRSSFVVSDHVLNAFTELWFVEEDLPDPAKYDSPTFNTNDSGRGTGIGGKYLVARIYPDSIEDDGFSTDSLTMPSDYDNSFDHNTSSYTTIEPNIQTGGASTRPIGILMLQISVDDFLENNSLNNLSAFKFDINAKELGIKTIDVSEARLYYASDGTNDRYITFPWLTSPSQGWDTSSSWVDLPTKTGEAVSISNATNTEPIVIVTSSAQDWYDGDKVKVDGVLGNTDANGEWSIRRNNSRNYVLVSSKGNGAYTSGGTATNITNKNKPYTVGLYVEGDNGSYLDSLMNIYEARLLFRYPQGRKHSFGWAACQGRTYGSWIDGRSSNYSSGDLIIDPAGIVESILRDELGLTDSDIDLESFIDAENTNMEMRLNLHSDNEENSVDVIRTVLEQSTFAFHYSGSGKARALPLNNASPTTDLIIPYSHIKKDSLKVSKTKTIYNYGNIRSRYLAEYDDYGDVTAFINASSQSNYGSDGTKEYEADWGNLAGTSVDHLIDHLFENSNSILSRPLVLISLTAKGFTAAHLQEGDYIELESYSTDPHLKCYGESWSGKQFLVYDLSISSETDIKAVQLYG